MLKKDRIDASGFKHPIIYTIFTEILVFMIYCYQEILKNESYNEGDYDEDILRNDLKRYLESNQERLIHKVCFRTESATIDSKTKKTKGRIDISVIYSLGLHSENDITFECKRLANDKKNQDYIKDGLMDFVSGKYAEKMPVGGMIGFVEKGNIKTICADLKKKIHNKSLTNIKGKFTTTKVQDDFEHSYKSEHKRNKSTGNIIIYHLIFDYTGIIRKAQMPINFN